MFVYELQRIISEIDIKKQFINDLKKNSNMFKYLTMNNCLVEDMKDHYLLNVEYIEKLSLETFHKIKKKYPDEHYNKKDK